MTKKQLFQSLLDTGTEPKAVKKIYADVMKWIDSPLPVDDKLREIMVIFLPHTLDYSLLLEERWSKIRVLCNKFAILWVCGQRWRPLSELPTETGSYHVIVKTGEPTPPVRFNAHTRRWAQEIYKWRTEVVYE